MFPKKLQAYKKQKRGKRFKKIHKKKDEKKDYVINRDPLLIIELPMHINYFWTLYLGVLPVVSGRGGG